MKKTLLLISAMVLSMATIHSCKKADVAPAEPEPSPPKTCFTMSYIQDVEWRATRNGFDAPKLLSNGQYYEGGQLKGMWTSNACDCVIVRNAAVPANNFFFKIAKLSPDTLQVYTARFGTNLFIR